MSDDTAPFARTYHFEDRGGRKMLAGKVFYAHLLRISFDRYQALDIIAELARQLQTPQMAPGGQPRYDLTFSGELMDTTEGDRIAP
jgi:hypothetical protein